MKARLIIVVFGIAFLISTQSTAQQGLGIYIGGSFFFSGVESYSNATYFEPVARIPSPFVGVEYLLPLKNPDYMLSTRLKTTYITQFYNAPFLDDNMPSNWLMETYLVKAGNVDLNASIEKTIAKGELSKLNATLGVGIETIFYNKKTYEIAARDTIHGEPFMQLGTEVVNFSPTINAGIIYRRYHVNDSFWNFGLDFTWALRKKMGAQHYTYGKDPDFVDEGSFTFSGSKISVSVGYTFRNKKK